MIRVREQMQKRLFHGVMAVEVVMNSRAARPGIPVWFNESTPEMLRLPMMDH